MRPWSPPYSSSRSAVSFPDFRNSSRSFRLAIDSGRNRGSRTSALRFRDFPESVCVRISRVWTTPSTLSRVWSQSGNKAWPELRTFCMTCSGESARRSTTRSFRGVIRVLTRLAPRRNTRSTIAPSSFSITPASAPWRTRILISSSVTGGSVDRRIRNSARITFVEAPSKSTAGDAIRARNRMGPAMNTAMRSGLLRASRFGTSSPRISERYVMARTTRTTPKVSA